MRQLPWNDDVDATVAALRALAPPPAEVQADGRSASSPTCALAATRPCAHRRHGSTAWSCPKDYAAPAAELRDAAGRAAARAARSASRRPPPTSAPTTSARRVAPWRETLAQGQVVGQEVVPLAVAGLYVPGGLADYPSSVLMTAIPAQVAGVGRIVVCSPPRPGGGAAAGVAAACALLGVDLLFPIGGAQAVAAMALRHRPVPRCDVIVGPGNAYVTEAKRQVIGEVGIDSLAGPSEVLIIADHAGEPAWLAADLLAQAEHGSGAMACLADIGGTLAGPVAARRRARSPPSSASPRQRRHRRLPGPRGRARPQQRVRARAPRAALRRRARAGAAACATPAPSSSGRTPRPPSPTTPPAPTTCCPPAARARFGQGLSVDAFQKRMAVVELDGRRGRRPRAAGGGHRRRGGPARARALRPPARRSEELP